MWHFPPCTSLRKHCWSLWPALKLHGGLFLAKPKSLCPAIHSLSFQGTYAFLVVHTYVADIRIFCIREHICKEQGSVGKAASKQDTGCVYQSCIFRYFVLLKCLVVNVTLLGCAGICGWEHIQLCKIYKFMTIALPLNFLLVLWEFCTINFGHIPFPLSTPPTPTPLLLPMKYNLCCLYVSDMRPSLEHGQFASDYSLKENGLYFLVSINCLSGAAWLGEGLCAFLLQAGIWDCTGLMMLPQPLWVHICNCPAILEKNHFLVAIYCLWLLHSFLPLFLNDSWDLGEGVVTEMSRLVLGVPILLFSVPWPDSVLITANRSCSVNGCEI